MMNLHRSPTQEDAEHIQNSKLLTKLLFLVDTGTRNIGTIELPKGTFGGVISFESYRNLKVNVIYYQADSECDSAWQWKVWIPERTLVFHAVEREDELDVARCEAKEKIAKGPLFLWRHERPHGRLPPSNTYIGGWKNKMPPLSERRYELLEYTAGEWEKEITRIAKERLEPNSRLFDVPYRSRRILRLTPTQMAPYLKAVGAA